jgi:hypothetical protein
MFSCSKTVSCASRAAASPPTLPPASPQSFKNAHLRTGWVELSPEGSLPGDQTYARIDPVLDVTHRRGGVHPRMLASAIGQLFVARDEPNERVVARTGHGGPGGGDWMAHWPLSEIFAGGRLIVLNDTVRSFASSLRTKRGLYEVSYLLDHRRGN